MANFNENTKIQVIIEDENFRDALYFTLEEFESLTDEIIDTKKKERIDNWRENIQNQPEPTEITIEELEEQKADLEAQIVELDEKIADLNENGE